MSQPYNPQEVSDKWEAFYEEYGYTFKINEVAQAYPTKRSVVVEFADLDRFDPDFAEFVLKHPEHCIAQARSALANAIQSTGHYEINVRIARMPADSYVKIRDLRAMHMGRLLAIKGLVKKSVEVRPRILNSAFKCERCGYVTMVFQDDPSRLKEPFVCSQEDGGCGRAQSSTEFKVLADRSTFVDSQQIELEELPEELEGGARAERLTIVLEDDLTGTVNPGEIISVNGPLMSAPRRNNRGTQMPIFDIFMNANNVDKLETDFGEIEISPEEKMEILRTSKEADLWPKMKKSISPSIKGLDIIKEALVLQLFGGVVKEEPDGQRIRGDIHILLMGDPGTAKSQLLRYMSKLSPRGRYTQGKASSAAGLTAAAVRDEFGDGRWSLEAGALVLADKGLACIDELDKMDPQDRSSLHEAMEQQTVTVTKAGINATLQARCSMLAAANPEYGRFDKTQPYVNQISKNINHALLTRFDIIFTIADEPNPTADNEISTHILKSHLLGEALARRKLGDSTAEIRKVIEDNYGDLEVPYKSDFLRKYIAHAKKEIFPLMSDKAMEKIKAFYLKLRGGDEGQQGPKTVSITARKLEALVRLAEAGARVRLAPVVEESDAQRAIDIINYYLETQAVGESGKLDIDVLESGIGASQRTQIAVIRAILKEYDEPGGVPMDRIIENAASRGVSRGGVKSILDLMRTRGDVFVPKEGHYRLLEK